jgi:hypothetical protein
VEVGCLTPRDLLAGLVGALDLENHGFHAPVVAP